MAISAPDEGRAEYKDALRAHRAARDEILTEEQQALLQRVHRHLEEQKLSAAARWEEEGPSIRAPLRSARTNGRAEGTVAPAVAAAAGRISGAEGV